MFYKINNLLVKSDIALFTERTSYIDQDFHLEIRSSSNIKPFDNLTTFVNKEIHYKDKNNILFKITDGNLIEYSCDDSDKKYLPKEIMGLPLGYALFQKGFTVLHASSISHNNKGIIFSGLSGSGKSTIISDLINKGFDYLSDDLVCLDNKNNLHSYTNTLAVQSIGKFTKQYFTEITTLNDKRKRSLYLHNKINKIPTPAKLCYFLKWGSKNDIYELKGVQLFEKIFPNLFREENFKGNQIDKKLLRQRLIADVSNLSSLKCFLIERNLKENSSFLHKIEKHIDSQMQNEEK